MKFSQIAPVVSFQYDKIERINKDMKLILYSPELLGLHSEDDDIADIRMQKQANDNL